MSTKATQILQVTEKIQDNIMGILKPLTIIDG